MLSNAGPPLEAYEEELHAFATRHGFDERRSFSGLHAIAPDRTFEIVIVTVPTAEPDYYFVARSPPERRLPGRVFAHAARLAGRVRPAVSFTLMPVPRHMPLGEMFTNDAVFDQTYIVRPNTPEVRALFLPELRTMLVDAAPLTITVTEGVVTMHLGSGPPDSGERLRMVGGLLVSVRQALAHSRGSTT